MTRSDNLLRSPIYFIVTLVILCLVLTSCFKRECENRAGDCPPYPDFMVKALKYKEGDSLRFVNEFGQRIGFRIESYNRLHNTDFDCEQIGDQTCFCRTCETWQNFKAITNDRPWPSIDSNQLTLYDRCFYEEGIFRWRAFSFRVFDLTKGGSRRWSKFPVSDIYFETYNLGGVEYKRVYVVEDSTESISRVYISLNDGIVGFDEVKTPSTYHLIE